MLEIEITNFGFDLHYNENRTNDSNNTTINLPSTSRQLSREEYFEQNLNEVKNEVKSEYDFIDLDSGSEDDEVSDVEENNHEGAKENTVPKISLVPLQGRVGDGVDFLLIFF